MNRETPARSRTRSQILSELDYFAEKPSFAYFPTTSTRILLRGQKYSPRMLKEELDYLIEKKLVKKAPIPEEIQWKFDRVFMGDKRVNSANSREVFLLNHTDPEFVWTHLRRKLRLKDWRAFQAEKDGVKPGSKIKRPEGGPRVYTRGAVPEGEASGELIKSGNQSSGPRTPM